MEHKQNLFINLILLTFHMHGNMSYLGFLHLIAVDSCHAVLFSARLLLAKFSSLCNAKGSAE